MAASFAATDGFFSGELNWVTGAITYKLDAANTVGINGGTHFSTYNKFDFSERSFRNQFATPATLQNSSIISVNYTYADGPWIVTPYVQYTSVERNDFPAVPVAGPKRSAPRCWLLMPSQTTSPWPAASSTSPRAEPVGTSADRASSMVPAVRPSPSP